jgi:predicted nucleic acid-binding protein
VAHYLDTSALVKLVVAEPETDALRAWLGEVDGGVVTCDLARAELLRAVRRVVPERAVRARLVLDSLDLLSVTATTFDAAGRLEPASLRTLDAVHLAAALELGDDLRSLVTYDGRLAAAAQAHGVPVSAPA